MCGCADRFLEIAGAPANVSKKYDDIVSKVKRSGGAVNPYAVARAQINKMYTKGFKRKQTAAERLHQVELWAGRSAARKGKELYMAELASKEAAAATSLGQMFRNQPIKPEWAAWRALRMRRAHAAAGMFEQAMQPAHTCGENCPIHRKEAKRKAA